MLHIIMPMAGDGIRFKEAGYSSIKPIINVNGAPMFSYPLESLPLNQIEHTITFIIKKSDNVGDIVSSALKSHSPNSNVIVLPSSTNGPLETIFPALKALPPEDAVLVLDCDLKFFAHDFNLYLLKNQFDHSAVLSFESDLPHFSYARIGLNKMVAETAEKKPISRNALAGVYFFHQAKFLLEVAKESLQHSSTYKYYIAPLYNRLIAHNLSVMSYEMSHYHSLGTPSELELYLSTITH